MAYQNGTFQYFDNQFLYHKNDYKKPNIVHYPEGTFQEYLQQNYPKWFLLLQKSGRIDYFRSMKNYTMFVPNNISTEDVINSDKNTALRLINYHTLQGCFPLNVIMTSENQSLNTLIDGIMIYANVMNDELILNNYSKIIKSDIYRENIIIHIIDYPLNMIDKYR